MRIRVAPGCVAPLGGRRSSSRKGGEYDVVLEGPAHEWRLRHARGVTILDEPAPSFPALEERGITLESAARMSDDDLLALKGVGPATVTAIRKAAATTTTEEE